MLKTKQNNYVAGRSEPPLGSTRSVDLRKELCAEGGFLPVRMHVECDALQTSPEAAGGCTRTISVQRDGTTQATKARGAANVSCSTPQVPADRGAACREFGRSAVARLKIAG